MSCVEGLTPQQRDFALHPRGAFVEACPGAGKTKTIVARLCNISSILSPRRGVAILSFTNTAVDEFRKRCREAELDAVLRHPSYMGTLDAFVRHFMVLPTQSSAAQRRAIIVDSWDTLDVGIRLAGADAFPGQAASLDAFDAATGLVIPQRIAHVALRAHVLQHQARYEQVAQARRRGLLQAGYMSASDARVQVLRVLQDPVIGSALGRAISARFHEVMIDEGQDCNTLDLQILTWLRAHGIQITFVCDPGQAIYEFRGSDPAAIERFKATFPATSQLRLTGNFRSTRIICRLTSTFRNVAQVDDALGDTANVAHPILLLGYAGRPSEAIGGAFAGWLLELGDAPRDAMLLAHAAPTALRAAGGPAPIESSGSSRVEQMARTIAEFRSPAATPRSREEGVARVELMLLDLTGRRHKGEHLLRALERSAVNRREHRRLSLALLTSLPSQCADSEVARTGWINELLAQVQNLRLKLPPGTTLRGFFRTPRNGRWAKHLSSPTAAGLACSTVHQAKGRQYDAVCVVIPPDRGVSTRTRGLLDAWTGRVESEAKRVVYVGLTRARLAAAIAIPRAHADEVAAEMGLHQIAFVRRDIAPR